MQVSQHTLDAAARFRAAQEALLSLPVKAATLEQMQAAIAAHQGAMEALAYAALDDVQGITREAAGEQPTHR